MKKTISVVIPVYNVAAYLPACLDSVLAQSYEDLEILLVDDGSTDGSGRLCDEYAARDGRIRVVHQKNGGAAAAKNRALSLATGEYLSFVDSDDYLEPGAYAYMVGLLEETRADAAQFAFRYVSPEKSEDLVCRQGREVIDRMEYLRRLPFDWTSALLWDKLYRRRLFDGVRFEEGHKIDDEFFTYQGFLNAQTVALDDRIVYNYRRRASSVMLSPKARAQRSVDRVQALCSRRETVLRRFPELREIYDTQFLDALIYMSEYPDNSPGSLSLTKKALRTYLLHPGNTFPPKRFLPGIARLLLTPQRTLLRQTEAPQNSSPTEDYFP